MKHLCVLLVVALTNIVAAQEYRAKNFDELYGMKGFSSDLLKQHFTLYQGYVKNTNILDQKLAELTKSGKERSPEYAGLKRMYGWEFDGMRLHELYFENLGGKTPISKGSDLYKAIEQEFGSYENWKKDFEATGLIKGIGWAVLYEDRRTGKLTNTWINEHNLGHLAGSKPLLVMDVWEHAYITEYGLDRAQYIDAFFNNIDWDMVGKRFENR